jgi:hypothetical protein
MRSPAERSNMKKKKNGDQRSSACGSKQTAIESNPRLFQEHMGIVFCHIQKPNKAETLYDPISNSFH